MTPGMPFSDLMGLEIVEREKSRVVGRLMVREDPCTAGGILHGGAYMAFADALGAVGGALNLTPGTCITNAGGKLMALVTQTQMTVEAA